MRDLWEFIGIIQQQLNGHWDIARLIEPYGGIHRILLPKLMFYLDYRFFSGSNIFSLSVSLLLHMSSALLVIWSINNYRQFNTQEKILLSATAVFFFFSTTQIYNLIYNSDNQVVISHVIAIFSVWFYSRNKLITSYILVLVACLSHSSSLMVLPAILLMQIASKRPTKEILIQLIFTVTLLLIYISGHDPLQQNEQVLPFWKKLLTTIYSVITQAGGILRYIGMHLSSPTSRLWPGAGIIITYLSIAYVAWQLYRIYRGQWKINPLETFWLTLVLYVFFIAVVTAYGRQIFPNSALTDRYQTLVMTYWAALMILIYIQYRNTFSAVRWSIPCVTLCLLVPHQYTSAQEMAWLSSRVSRAHTAAIVDITDINTVAATLSHPLLMDKKNLVAKYNHFLRQNRLGYFSFSEAGYFLDGPGERTWAYRTKETNECQGEILELRRLGDNALRISGQGNINGQAPATVFFVDSKDLIVGLGRDMRQKGEFAPLSLRDVSETQWVGFINTKKPVSFPVRALAVSGENYCTLNLISLSNQRPLVD